MHGGVVARRIGTKVVLTIVGAFSGITEARKYYTLKRAEPHQAGDLGKLSSWLRMVRRMVRSSYVRTAIHRGMFELAERRTIRNGSESPKPYQQANR
jgi:hypothetical protein